ncbi:MAG TPA: hypothetical protein VLF59_02250 [Candidatus Saccharimonadales bacterium]|nr:hypothetical protein [Candidatus Saccharimonadales bacterium]
MERQIDFSGLPPAQANPSVWRIFKLPLLITFLLLLTLGPFIYISEVQPKSLLGYIPGAVEIIAVPTILYVAYRALSGNIKKQQAIMRVFARHNNWQFEGTQKLSNSTSLPVSWSFLGSTARQIYRIHGSLLGEPFELYAVQGFDSTSFRTLYGSVTLGYRTVLRTRIPLNASDRASNIQIIDDNGWNYVLMNANAITSSEIRAIFQPIMLSNSKEESTTT